MNKVTSYFKNVKKSVEYATVKTVSEKMLPEVSSFMQTNNELFKAIYATVSHSKKSIQHAKKVSRDSQIYKDINTLINNTFEDIKTGNFYNKEREEKSSDDIADVMLNSFDDFDFDFDDFDDGSLDDFQDKPVSIDKGDILITETVAKSSNLSAQLISKTVANTSKNIINASIASTNIAMAQNVELVAGIRTSIAGVHESINSIFKLANEKITEQTNLQTQFFNDSINIIKENNAFLKEIAEIQRNLYKKKVEESKTKDQFNAVYGGGVLDLTEYFKAIGNNLKNLDKTGTVSTLTTNIGGSSMLSQFFSNPLGGIMVGLIERFMPAKTVKSIASFDKALGNIFPTLITKLNRWKNEYGIKGILGNIFGLSTDDKKTIDTSKYEKGAVPFDGITRKAIVDVIPEHLARIESILSGSSQRIYDYHSGKWMSVKDIKKKQEDDYKYMVKDSFFEMRNDINRFIKELEKDKAIDNTQRKSIEEDIYKMMEYVFKNGGFFSPEELKKKNLKYENKEVMDALLDAFSDNTHYKLGKITSVSSRSIDNINRYSRQMKEYQAQGDSVERKIYDKSASDITKTNGLNILNIRDDSNMNVLDYLKGILTNVSYIREHGIENNSNFDEYSMKFNSHVFSQKNTANKSKGVINTKSLAKAVDSMVYEEQFSHLDEDKYSGFGYNEDHIIPFGYKDKNKYQEELESIPGDTFVQKFANAENMREKFTVILGSLSNIAKKPASIITGMIASAEQSIYNFLFKEETDMYDIDTKQKVKGFFQGMLNTMRAKWTELTVTLEEKVINPMAKKFGLEEKWEKLKEKLKNTKPAEYIRNITNDIKSALVSDIKGAGGSVKESFKNLFTGDDAALKEKLSKYSKEDIEYFKEKARKENPELLKRIENAGFDEGGTGIVTEPGSVQVSKGEIINVFNPNKSSSKNKQNERDNAYAELLGTNPAIAKVKRVAGEQMHYATQGATSLLEKLLGKLFGLGNTTKEQDDAIKEEQSNLKKNILNILDKQEGLGATTASKAIIGGGLGLLSGVAIGPLLGAGLGAAINIIKNNEAVNKILFGGEFTDKNGDPVTKKGILSQKVKDIFEKQLPDIGKSTAIGALSSLILPFGPLGGAVIGAGVGLAKNSTRMNEMLFGEEDGLFNLDRKEKLKKALPKAAIGAAAGMFLGPFGLVGNAAIGASAGLLTGAEEFKDLIFGEKDNNGDRIGGLKGALKEHFIDPIVNFGRNFKEDFFGFIKESMIDPLNNAITPIAEEIAFQTKRVVFGIPKWFMNLGKDYIAVPILNKLNDKVIDPIAKGIKGLFGSMWSKFKGVVSLPFRAVGGIGNAARKHQIKQGRDVVGKSASERLKFAEESGMGDYKYKTFDSKVAENADNEEWLEELAARTGMLSHGAKYFDEEVKKTRKELSRVVSDYYKLGWFSKDKKSYKRIRQYIHDNDVEAAIEELTNIQKSRTTGGPLSGEASDAISRFSRANRAYQVARDNRNKFGDINETENAAWMEQQFGPDWRKLKSQRLFDYATRELKTATGRSVTKADVVTDPRQIVTKGESEINTTLRKIYTLLSGDEYTFSDERDNELYDQQEASGNARVKSNLDSKLERIRSAVDYKGFKLNDESVNLLYENPLVYELALVASEIGINYDNATIARLCGMKLSKNEIELLKKYPYVALSDDHTIKKTLNFKRNDHGTIFNNRLFGAKAIRNDNLNLLNLAQKANNEFDINTADIAKSDDKATYVNTNYGLRRYVKDDYGKFTVDTSDAETKESLLKEQADQKYKESFMGSISSLKDNVVGFFTHNKEKEIEEKKEPWYKRLFNFSLGGKLKLGAGLLALITAVGAIKNIINPNDSDGTDAGQTTDNSFIGKMGQSIGKAITPAVTTVHDWFTNEGEYAASDKGLTGFMDKHVFPNLFAGMNVFFGKVLPAVVTAFIKNIPTLVGAGIKGVGSLFGWHDDNNSAANVSFSNLKTASGTEVSSSGNNSWLSKVSSDSTAIANSITAIDTSNTTATVNNSSTGTTSSSTPGINEFLKGINSGYTAYAATNTSGISSISSNTTGNPNEPVEMEGIGPIYKKVDGKLVPITAGEAMNIKEFWNESGKGHWVYDDSTGQFVADSGTATQKGLPQVLGYAALRSALTHQMPGIFGDTSKAIFKGADNVLSKIPGYKVLSAPVKGVATGFEKVAKAGQRAGISGINAFEDAKNAGTFDKSLFQRISESRSTKKEANAAKAAAKAGPSIGNAAKSFDKYEKGLWNKVKSFISDGLNKIFGTKVVKDKLEDAVKESAGGKISGSAKALNKKVNTTVKSIIDTFMKNIMKVLPKSGATIISKISRGIASGVFAIFFVAQDFIGGIDKAEAILGIKEPNALQSFLAGLANIISKRLLFGLIDTSVIVGWLIDWILPLFNIDNTKIQQQRDEAKAEVDAYNKANGENLSVKEYLERNNSITGKMKYKTKNAWNKVKKGVNNSWEKTKKGVGNIGNKLASKAKSIASGFTNDDKIRKTLGLSEDTEILFRDKLASGIGNLTGSKNMAYGIEGIFAVGDSVKEGMLETKDDFSKYWSKVKTKSKNALDYISNKVEEQWDALKDGVTKGFNSVNTKFGALLGLTDDKGNPISLTESLKQDGKKIIKDLSSYWSGVKERSVKAWDIVSDKAKDGYEDLKTGLGKGVKWLDAQLGALLGIEDGDGNILSLTETISKSTKNVKKTLSKWWTKFKEDTATFGDSVRNFFSGSWIVKEGEESIDDRNAGSGTLSGLGTAFYSQVDPKYKNKKFNTSSDTQMQTIADAGCAPATAANVISLYEGQGNTFERATTAALKYKNKNSGVTPDYFENYLGKKGISTYSTTDKTQLINSISAGQPTILFGTDPTNRARTPYGASSSHYVLATGLDGKGNVIIQDPESRQPNTLYPIKDVINQSHMGMITSKSGMGTRKVGRFSSIKNKINSKINFAGKGKAEIEKTVWSQLRGAGFSEIQVAGIMGNIKHESGFDPSIIERSGGGGYGLCQWTGGRRTKLENYAKSLNKKASDLNVQIAFLVAEMTPGGGANGYASYQFSKSSTKYDGKTYTIDTFRDTSSVEVATRAFCFCFERPSYSSSVNHIDSRIKSAKAYYDKYKGTSASSNSLTGENTAIEPANTSTLFGALQEAALSYYDKNLLALLGFTSNDTPVDASSSSVTGVSGSAAEVLRVAEAEIGTKEQPDGSNKQKYGKEYGLNGQPWCGIFVWWVFKHAGCLDLISDCPNIAYVPTIYNHFKKKGQIVNKNNGKPGDLFLSGGKSHVGIIKENKGNGKYVTIEGNCGNKVKSIERTDVSYVVRINYNAGSGQGSGKQKIITQYNDLYKKDRSYNNKIAAISSGKGTSKIKSPIGRLSSRVSSRTNEPDIRTYVSTRSSSNISMPNYNALRERVGKGTGFALPDLNSSYRPSYSGTTGSNYRSIGSTPTESSTDKLLSVIIDVLSIIANNSEKLSEIVSLLSKALDMNLSNDDISKLSSNNAQIKNKIANALKGQGSSTGMGNSVMNSTTESLAAAMYSIASA